MNQHPDYTEYIKGVILSANDVIATVLLLYEDEGYSPLNIASVSLPPNGREYRAKSKNGKSRFQRGDLIQIDCKIVNQKKQQFTEDDFEELLDLKTSMEDEDEAERTLRIFEEQERFAEEWIELEKRDLEKRLNTEASE